MSHPAIRPKNYKVNLHMMYNCLFLVMSVGFFKLKYIVFSAVMNNMQTRENRFIPAGIMWEFLKGPSFRVSLRKCHSSGKEDGTASYDKNAEHCRAVVLKEDSLPSFRFFGRYKQNIINSSR